MTQWIFLNEIEQARSLYLDAYRQVQGSASPMIGPSKWDDVRWLEEETEKLILNSITINEQSDQ